MEEILADIFEKLEKWRGFPKYQLERRLDIFISAYLPEILKMSVKELKNVDINEIKNNIYPEFPLKKVNNCSSDNADYAIFIEQTKTIYLIELKTDMNSINDTQLNYYLRYCSKLNKRNNKQIIENIFYDIIKIENKSDKYEKYDYLLNELIYGNQNSNPSKYIENKRQWKDIGKEYDNKIILKNKDQQKDLEEKIDKFQNIEIIYITPKVDNKINKAFKVIEFEDIINILKQKEESNLILEKLYDLLDLISK